MKRVAALAVAALAVGACQEQPTQPLLTPGSTPLASGAEVPSTIDARNLAALSAGPSLSLSVDKLGAASTSITLGPNGYLISNGTVLLGVNPEAQLNAPYPGDPIGINYAGLRYVPTGYPSTEPGCLCEGWGVGDEKTSAAGGANQANGGAFNLVLESYTNDGTTAVSVVRAANTFRVTHEYKPSPATPNLYEVNVTLENISAAAVTPRYRRVMDWDIYPTPFAEMVTIKRGTATDLYRTDNNGFESWNPFSFYSYGLLNVDFEDAGPADHGALFDFRFADLAPGESRTFKTYYGAAGTEADALAALGAVGAEAYSLGQPSSAGGPNVGVPNTFIFGFGGIGGKPIEPPPVNVAPVADAGGPYASDEGDEVVLDGSASSDPDGDDLSYYWDVDGDDVADYEGVSAAHTFGDEGLYPVKLTVSDGFLTSSETVEVTVSNVAPTGTFSAPASVDEGSPIALALSDLSDVAADLAELEVAFDCGAGYGAFGSDDAASCPTSNDGSVSVGARVKDSDGGETEYTATVAVANVAPAVDAGEGASLISGGSFTLNGSFADPGADSPWSYTISWGDGDSSTGEAAAPGAITGSHQYLTPGTYTVTLTVEDDDTSSSASVSVVVTALGVGIDILPGSNENPFKLNPKGNGTLPVAVLGSSSLDAGLIDVASIELGGVAVEQRGGGRHMASLEDVNGDGHADLVLHFSRPALIGSGSLTNTASVQTLTLTGALTDGRIIEGQDHVRTMP